MSFLKKIFSAAITGSGDSAGLYYYVKPQGCDEVVRVRINRNNDLSIDEDGKGYWVHKVVMGTTCFQRAELELHFNQNRQVKSSGISGGDLVKEADYKAWLASQEKTP